MGRIIVALVAVFATASLAAPGTPPPPAGLIPPYGINLFDYLQSEALTSAAIYSAQYPSVESQGAPSVCWVKGSTRQVRIVFQNPTNVEHDATLTLSDGSYSSWYET
jgi:hypothetical protein